VIRLVLSDVDGTLVQSDKSLSERSIAAAQELRTAGIAFAVTSGRPPRGMSMLVEPLDLTSPIAAFNGGLIVEPDLSVVEDRVVPDGLVARAVARFLSERYAIPPEEIATIGDMPNDVLMFAHSGLSIAMGNADREVQRAARRVTTSNDDDGFANAVERFILEKGASSAH
jgi:hydroxymethylpyrimidine pyrophosphatase-like HAD family hydrolase